MTGEDLSCECLVIGSGAGGALTASYLARQGRDVLVIEEGPDPASAADDASIAKTMPAFWREGGVIPVLSNVKLVYAEGRCLGGTTVMNAGLIHRVPEDTLARWQREFQVADLGPGSLRKHHESIERVLHAQVQNDQANPLSRLLKEGARKCGFSGADTPVAAGVVNGRLRKNDARRTFLKTAIGSGARIMTDCRAGRLRVKNRGVEMVEAVSRDAAGNRRSVQIHCKTVFLCAGPVQSALLLRRSGVNKNVGNSIHFHPTLRVVAEFPTPIRSHEFGMPAFQINEFAPEFKLGASVNAPAYLATGLSMGQGGGRDYLDRVNNMASFYVSTTCDTNGIVRNIPFLSSYLIQYRVSGQALRNLGAGFARLSEMLFASGAIRLFPSVEGAYPVTNMDEAQCCLPAGNPSPGLNLATVHAFSSCPLGEDRSKCAVDSFGRLHGYRNVYVNDASILPSSPEVNPQGPIMALVHRNLEANFG